MEKILQNEKNVKTIEKLASLTIRIPVEAVNNPGYFYSLTKALNWESINIIEIVSTLRELTFILRDIDISRAFETIKKLIEEK